jgi:hypothetical protein
MGTIKIFTGQEWHSSYGAKGYVFWLDPETLKEVPIHLAKEVATLVETDWTDIGGGKHGKWCEATYEVRDGTILKLFAISTRGDVPDGGGGAFVRIDETAPCAILSGDGYQDRYGSITAPMKLLSLEEVIAMGVTIDPRYKRYYKPGTTKFEVCGEEKLEEGAKE